jgi:AraC family transcriptional regulator
MTPEPQSERIFQNTGRLGDAAEWPNLRVEHWYLEAGPRPDVYFENTVVALLLAGRPGLRRSDDGEVQKFAAHPGMAWVCPAGTRDRNIEFVTPMEVIHLCLPSPMIAHRTLTDYEIDPAKVELVYAAGVADPTLLQIGIALKELAARGEQATDRLFADGMQMALVGHLLHKYSVDRWQPLTNAPTLDAKRLTRVLDYIEARLADEIGLEDLAAEACLSPYHFTRLFREATGLPPHRYLTEQRVEAAKAKLRFMHSSLAEIGHDTGFGSQANFTRAFRKATGLTPGQYRRLYAG